MEGASEGNITFRVYIESFLEEVEDNSTQVAIISVSITFGGLTIIVILIMIVFIRKKLRERKIRKAREAKSIHIMSKKQDGAVGEDDEKLAGNKEEEDENIEFDENQEKNTLETPKPSSGEQKTRNSKKVVAKAR